MKLTKKQMEKVIQKFYDTSMEDLEYRALVDEATQWHLKYGAENPDLVGKCFDYLDKKCQNMIRIEQRKLANRRSKKNGESSTG